MEYYRRVAYEPDVKWEEEEEVSDDVFVDKMMQILSSFPNIGVPYEPTQIRHGVFLGTSANAENIPLLKAKGINYILNCAGTGSTFKFRRVKELYTPETGIMGYQELIFDDSETSNARPYFERAHSFIDFARERAGKVLIFCSGVSRSGVIALSYLVKSNIPVLGATRLIKDQRRTVLCNENFMRQLVEYARERRMLDPDVTQVHAPKYGRKIDRQRIIRAHLPMFM